MDRRSDTIRSGGPTRSSADVSVPHNAATPRARFSGTQVPQLSPRPRASGLRLSQGASLPEASLHTASDLWHTGPGPHMQLPCRTACRRCLALPEPRALAPALCSVAVVGTVQSDSRAWHTARDLRSLLQPFHFSWTGLSPSRTPPRQFALAPCCSRRACALCLPWHPSCLRCRTLTTPTRRTTRLAAATGERPESNMAAEAQYHHA